MRPIFLIAITSTFFNLACNHLFYYPDKFVRVTPDKIHLKYDEFYIKTEDDMKLHGWKILAGNTEPKSLDKPKNSESVEKAPLGTIVQFHGNAENMTSHFLYLAWLVPLGFDLITFDYRGYGKSEGEPSREGLILDGIAMMNWVKNHSRSEKIVVVGHSLGGAVAIPTLARIKGDDIRALVVDSTFASYREVARMKLKELWVTWLFHVPLSFLISDDQSPVDDIGSLQMPKLFIHAAQDPVVPYVTGKKLYEAAHPPREFWTIPQGGVGDGHTGAFVSENQEYRLRFLKYLCATLSIHHCPLETLKQSSPGK